MPKIESFISLGSINLDRKSQTPLHGQIYKELRHKILTRELLPGERLPSTRVMAQEIGVGRNTVINAFNQLISEGYLESTVGSGTVVTTSLPENMITDHSRKYRKNEGSGNAAGRKPKFSKNVESLLQVPFLENAKLKPFTPALPAIEEYFIKTWESIMIKTWRKMSRSQFGYASAIGYTPLREVIASYLRTARGVKCRSDQVIITNGAQQALNLTAQLLLNHDDTVWIEDPCYNGAKAAFSSISSNIIPLPIDASGISIEKGLQEAPQARLVYISPSNQFPLGVTMGLQRRLEIIKWAVDNHSWIIEDDYDSEFRYSGSPVMALQGIDHSDRVIYIGTFSKVLYPSLRLGYMVVPENLIKPFHTLRAHADRGSAIFEQIVLHEFIKQGYFARHIRRMKKIYSERRKAMIAAMEKHLKGVIEPSSGEAGLHIVTILPRGVDDQRISRLLKEAGYDVPPLSAYYIARPETGGLLFGFTALDASEMDRTFREIAPIIIHNIL